MEYMVNPKYITATCQTGPIKYEYDSKKSREKALSSLGNGRMECFGMMSLRKRWKKISFITVFTLGVPPLMS